MSPSPMRKRLGQCSPARRRRSSPAGSASVRRPRRPPRRRGRAGPCTSGARSDRMSCDTVARSRWPCSMRLKRARLVLSQSCSVFLLRRVAQVADHLVDVVLELGDLALRLDRDHAGQVALGHGRRHVGDRADLGREVGRQLVDVVGEVAPRCRRRPAPGPGRPAGPRCRLRARRWSPDRRRWPGCRSSR